MDAMIDWDEAAKKLKRDVGEHGGFLTMQRDELRERFGIGKLGVKISEDLWTTLYEAGMIVFPHPYDTCGNTVRVYADESDIGRIAQAVVDPQTVPETALADTVDLYRRRNAALDGRSDDVPWLTALDVFLQLVIGRPPDGWEDSRDDREPYQLRDAIAETLGFAQGISDAKETRRIAGAVCACRPHRLQWEGSPPSLGEALAEAAREQKEIFDRVLREAAMHLLGGTELPSRNVELGRLGLRYRREAQGGVGWVR